MEKSVETNNFLGKEKVGKLLKIFAVPSVTQGVITLAFKVFGIVVSIIVGIAAGGQPIIGYNYGTKQYDRVKETFKKIMTATIIVGIVSTLIFEICPQIFLYVFGNGGDGVNPELYREFTCITFRIYLGFILLTCVIKSSSIFFQSIGKPVTASLISMFRDLIFLIPAILILVNIGGIDAMLWSAGISDVLTFIFAVVCLVLIFKKLPQTATNEISSNKTVIHKSKQGLIITISREHGSGGREIAKNFIEKSDKKRASFYNEITGQTWGNKENYDVCINGEMGTISAVQIIKECIKSNKS